MKTKANELSRRQFLQIAGATGMVAGLAACRQAEVTETAVATTAPALASEPEPIDIDGEHAAKTQAFLDGIGTNDAFWGTPLEYTLDGDVKVFDLYCRQVDWEVEPGKVVEAFTYNGIVPGPEFRVVEGDMVRIHVHNEMEQSTVVHWHGVKVPNAMDGVPMLTQPLIKPGESFTYEFEVKNPGSHMYHSHHNAIEQVLKGMLGAFIIEPKDKSQDPEYDADYTMVLNDTGIGYSINGKSFPATQPIMAKVGDKLRIRYMNEGLMIHPMHLHGLEQLVFSKDGWNLPQPYYCDTVNVAPGERYDVIVDCHTPGAWAFHCHILSHVDTIRGMFGMVTAVIVEE